jgi:hypothetical protein
LQIKKFAVTIMTIKKAPGSDNAAYAVWVVPILQGSDITERSASKEF